MQKHFACQSLIGEVDQIINHAIIAAVPCHDTLDSFQLCVT